MGRHEVARFEFGETVADKAWSHGVSTEQIDAVLDHFWTIIRNRANRAAPYVLLGSDHQGRCLAIPIAPTDDPVVWRPITAWYCKRSEAAKLRRGRSIMEEQIDYEALQQPLDDEERVLMDPNTWDWDSMEVGRTVGERGAIFSMRFSREEHHLLADVAYGQGITPHEFIKRVALAAARDGVKVDTLEPAQAAGA
jgi:hypothetical protein